MYTETLTVETTDWNQLKHNGNRNIFNNISLQTQEKHVHTDKAILLTFS
mgnify:CR=1 FL=1